MALIRRSFPIRILALLFMLAHVSAYTLAPALDAASHCCNGTSEVQDQESQTQTPHSPSHDAAKCIYCIMLASHSRQGEQPAQLQLHAITVAAPSQARLSPPRSHHSAGFLSRAPPAAQL